MSPLVSVIIPTRNRQMYLVDVVGAIKCHAPDAEIVVCDNSDTDDLRAALAEFIREGMVKYQYSDERLSVVENYERAFSMSSGEYVVFLGDDDCIGPGLMEIAAWAKRNGIDAVASYTDAFIANYYWPGVKSRFYGDGYEARLFVRECSGRTERVNARDAVRRVASKFGGGLGRMPRAYHGLVAKGFLDQIKRKYGSIFGGVSGDIYSATLISAEVKHYYIVDYPFVIPGASTSSAAGQGAARSDRGSLWSTDHIARFGEDLKWDERIPEFYSPYTVWAYSMLKALEKVPAFDIRPSFPRLYARCFLHCRGETAATAASFRTWAMEGSRSAGFMALAGAMVREAGATVWWLAKRLPHPKAGGGARVLSGLKRISEAYRALEEDLTSRGIKLHLDDVPGSA